METIQGNAPREDDMQIKLLEMRIHHLEEMRKSRANHFGDCCPCATVVCGCFGKTICSIPYLSILALCISVAGAYFCWEHEETLIDFIQRLKLYPEVKQGITSMTDVLAGVIFVDVFSVIAAVPLTGSFRDFCFSRNPYGRPHGGCRGCCQYVTGSLTLGIIMLILFAFFVAFFVGVLVAVPVVFFINLICASCKLDDTAVKIGLSNAFGHVPHEDTAKLNAYTKFAAESISTTCQDDYELLNRCALYYGLGLILITLGQAWQAIMTMNCFAKVIMTDTSTSDIAVPKTW